MINMVFVNGERPIPPRGAITGGPTGIGGGGSAAPPWGGGIGREGRGGGGADMITMDGMFCMSHLALRNQPLHLGCNLGSLASYECSNLSRSF